MKTWNVCLLAVITLLIMMSLMPDDSLAGFSFGGTFGGSTGGGDYASDMDAFGADAVSFIKCSLQGTGGMIIMGIGGIMALWEYFVQHRQMHMLYGILVIGLTLLLGAALPAPSSSGYTCGSSSTSGGWGWSFSFSGSTSGGEEE